MTTTVGYLKVFILRLITKHIKKNVECTHNLNAFAERNENSLEILCGTEGMKLSTYIIDFFTASGHPEKNWVNIRETFNFSLPYPKRHRNRRKNISWRATQKKSFQPPSRHLHTYIVEGEVEKQGLIKNDCRWMCSFVYQNRTVRQHKNIYCKIVFVTIRTTEQSSRGKKSCSEPN